MDAKFIGLVWITVKDLKKAIQFYTEVVGLKLTEMNDQWGWAELQGHEGGCKLGLAQQRLKSDDAVQPGQNAVMTFTVEDLQAAIRNLRQEGAHLVGPSEEVPGQVKLQTVKDTEGNIFQLVEIISQPKNHSSCHEHKTECCGGH